MAKVSGDRSQRNIYKEWTEYCLKDNTSLEPADMEKDLTDGAVVISFLLKNKYRDAFEKFKLDEYHNGVNPVSRSVDDILKLVEQTDKIPIVLISLWILVLFGSYSKIISKDAEPVLLAEAKQLIAEWLKANKTKHFNSWNYAIINKKQGLVGNYDDKFVNDSFNKVMKIANNLFGLSQASATIYDQSHEICIVFYIYYLCKKDFNARQMLMKWIQETIPECGISNFTTDWSDGTALGSLAHAVSGGNFPQHKEMSPSDPIANFTSSIQFATTLGIPEIVTPQELADPNLDPLTLVTYLTYFQSVQVPIEPTLPQDIHNLASIDLKVVVSGFGSIPINVNVTDSNGSVVVNEENEIKEDKHIMSYNNMTSESYTIEVAMKPPQDEPSISLITIVAFSALLFSVLLM